MYKLLVATIAATMLLGVTTVLADEGQEACAGDCPSGQVRTSYLDGHQVDCTCMDQGSGMQDDSSVVYGGEGEQNPENPS